MFTDRPFIRVPSLLISTASSLSMLLACSGIDDTVHSRVTGPLTTSASRGVGPTLIPIDYPDATLTVVNGISASGAAVGRFTATGGVRCGFVLGKHGSYHAIAYPGATATSATGIDASGDIVGDYSDGDRNHGYLLRNGTFVPIDFTDGVTVAHSTFSFAINPSGAVVGEYKILFKPLGDPGHAFLYEDGVFTHISPPGARAAVAWGINAAGQSVGYYMDQQVPSRGHGWRRDADGSYTVFDYPGASFTNARAINASGTIVGVYRDATPSTRSHGFILEEGTFTGFDYPGAIFTRLSGINARGDIVGDYQDAAGKTHSFLLIR